MAAAVLLPRTPYILRFMRRTHVLLIGGAVAFIAALALLVVLIVRTGAAPTANAAVLERIEKKADPRSARILVNRSWGEGRFVLARYQQGPKRRLALGFVLEQGGGWRLTAYTEKTVKLDDVGVASLLVASSEGGPGQPAWSAAAGEFGKGGSRVEIRWASGDVAAAARINSAYLVLQAGTTTPLEARYLAEDGREIARVPIDTPD
jgi:hypothetical protein